MKSDSSQRNPARWNTHVDVIQHIQRHVDTRGHDHSTSARAADTAQIWQKIALDRIAVMLSELTSNTSAVIRQFNRNPRNFDMDAFIEYLDHSAEQAVRLADQIADFANFGNSNGREKP